MGRTEPTFRHLIDRLEHEWRDYRRGLRADEQAAFDGLFQKARAHASASMNAGRLDPMEAILMSILLEQEKEIAALRRAIAAAPATRSARTEAPGGPASTT